MKAKETVPGYTLRNSDGDLVGFKCPISFKSFYGEDSERAQYRHTLAIMEAQGMDMKSIVERKALYQQGVGR